MPELPEVETTLRGIAPYLEGQALASTVIRNGALRWPVSKQVYSLENEKITGSLRRGKYIVIQFASGDLLIHLGMSGSLQLVSRSTLLKKHDHVDLNICSGRILRFNDPRRFGSILWSDNWQEHRLILNLGIEPLTKELSGDYLYQCSRGRKIQIKKMLMDSKILVGVGNIYANEVLYLAGIDPRRAAGQVSLKRMDKLAFEVKQVLTSAIKQGGTTLKDFVGSDGRPGYFKQHLYVYGRGGKPCLNCQAELQEFRQNGRSTVFCAKCQT